MLDVAQKMVLSLAVLYSVSSVVQLFLKSVLWIGCCSLKVYSGLDVALLLQPATTTFSNKVDSVFASIVVGCSNNATSNPEYNVKDGSILENVVVAGCSNSATSNPEYTFKDGSNNCTTLDTDYNTAKDKTIFCATSNTEYTFMDESINSTTFHPVYTIEDETSNSTPSNPEYTTKDKSINSSKFHPVFTIEDKTRNSTPFKLEYTIKDEPNNSLKLHTEYNVKDEPKNGSTLHTEYTVKKEDPEYNIHPSGKKISNENVYLKQ